MNSYHEYLPKTWVEIIDKDDILKELFSEYSSEEEPVPPFLFQDLRGGDLKHLKPIFALYGNPGLNLLGRLEEIDTLTQDTAQTQTEDGEVAYAGYFFTLPSSDEDMARVVVRDYIQAINQVYEIEFQEEPPLDKDAKIEFPTRVEADTIEKELHQASIRGIDIPEIDIHTSLGDWFCYLEYQDNCEELAELLSEPLYHISNSYFLSYYLQWELLAGMAMENPFLPYYKLWCMGLTAHFLDKNRIVIV